MTETTFRSALTQALAEELERDEDVILFGEDVARPGGVFKVTDGLQERFGEDRVLDTPIAEQAIIGCAIGAAATGLRPVAEIMFADFAGVCYDGIANQLAKFRYQTGGQFSMPVTVRMASGGSIGFAAQHSQTVENWFLNHAGLNICVPATPGDAYGLLKSAIRDDNPTLVFEHKALYPTKGEIVDGALVPLGRAYVVRAGTDITVVATQLMRHRCERAAEVLASEGVSVELVDPRTLVPLDAETILASVARTTRLLCVQECQEFGSWGASVLALVVREGFDSLDGPPRLLSAEPTPIPFARSLEEAWSPSEERIAAAIREQVGY